jgi:hypothetical protein
MTEDTILLEKSGGVARITLNRPALRNAFDDALISKLRAALIGRGSPRCRPPEEQQDHAQHGNTQGQD